MRVVIDTNVLISAIFWTGKPKHLLNQVRLGKLTFLTSIALLAELKEILTRKDKPFKLSVVEAEQVVAAMRDLAEIVEPRQRLSICQDEDDNRVLECALEGRAEWIITGDLHLLRLQSLQGVPIVTVAGFLSQYEEA